jgi:hypothetical protein
VTRVENLILTIEVVDLFNTDHQVTLSIPSEIAQDLEANKSVERRVPRSADAAACASTATRA